MKLVIQSGRIHYHERPNTFFSKCLDNFGLIVVDPSIEAHCGSVWLVVFMRLFERNHSFVIIKKNLDINLDECLLLGLNIEIL